VIITQRGHGSVMARRTVSPMTTVLHLAERLILCWLTAFTFAFGRFVGCF
jgi:hypothetical protein